MMRVAHICQADDANVGGSLSVARALTREQRKRGLEARVIYLYASVSCSSPQLVQADLRCEIARKFRWWKGVPRLRKVLRHFAPDLIHHHDGILWPRFATITFGCPLVTHGHLGVPNKNILSGAGLTHFVTKKTTDRLIAISDWVATSWESVGYPQARIRVIPNGVESDRFFPRSFAEKTALRDKLGLPLDERIVLWVGRLDRKTKGLDRLVAVASALNPPLHLVIVGDGPDRPWLKEKLKQIQPEGSRYTLVGKISDPSRHFGAADAFLFTSTIESFGLVLLEAAASGLPLFAFRCAGGGSDLLEKLGAMTVADNDIRDLAQKMSSFGKVDTKILEFVQSEYSWQSATTKIIELYRELKPLLSQKVPNTSI